jgi:hypothetical protein
MIHGNCAQRESLQSVTMQLVSMEQCASPRAGYESQKLGKATRRFRELRFRHNLARQLRPINPLEHSCPKWSMAPVLTIVLMVAGLP